MGIGSGRTSSRWAQARPNGEAGRLFEMVGPTTHDASEVAKEVSLLASAVTH
jgi:hypothetical protein